MTTPSDCPPPLTRNEVSLRDHFNEKLDLLGRELRTAIAAQKELTGLALASADKASDKAELAARSADFARKAEVEAEIRGLRAENVLLRDLLTRSEKDSREMTASLDARVGRIEGKGAGAGQAVGYIIAAITVAAAVLAIAARVVGQ